MENQKLFQDISAILNHSQDGMAGHAKLITKCQNLFKQVDFTEFFETFTLVTQSVMITMQKNPHIERIIEFIAKLATSMSNKKPQEERTLTENDASQQQKDATSMDIDQTDLEEEENQFLTCFIDYLIENSKSNSDAVRYRCCHILSKLMGSISNDQFIDEDLYDRLCDSMLERLKDINSRVQVQAIAAIYRLQDPNDRDCRVIKALLFLITYDPNWQVRYQALSHIAFSKMTLADIIERVRDPNANVRRKAIMILSEKVLIKFISIEKRLFLLNNSLKDNDAAVVDTVCKKLLPSWLAFKENDVCKLLKALDVVHATETCELMLNKMYAEHSNEQLCNEFNHTLNEKHIIPLEKLDAENVFFWAWLCSKCKQSPSNTSEENKENQYNQTQENMAAKDNGEGEDCLDRLLPSLTEYCEFTQMVLKKIERDQEEKLNDARLQAENVFIMKQVFKMFSYIDFSDIHGKKMLQSLCHELFANKNCSEYFEQIMKVYKLIQPNLQQRINSIVELISDLRDPTSSTSDSAQKQDINNPNQVETGTNLMETESNADQMFTTSTETNKQSNDSNTKLNTRELSLKISELKFKRLNLKDEFDNLYKDMKNVDKNVDMNKLSELRVEIKSVEDELAQLQAQLTGAATATTTNANSNQSTLVNTVTGVNQNQATIQQPEMNQPTEECTFDPVESAYHCLELAVCLLQDLDLKTLTPQLRSLCDNLILPNIGSVHEHIRLISVRALNLVCILKLELAQKYVPLLIEIINCDQKPVIIEAFKALINVIMAYSLNKLVDDSNTSMNGGSDEQNANLVQEATSKILSVMTSLLDYDDSEICTIAVEGFCKLYMTGHILSAKLFSKLVIMYYSPLTENDVKLRACLSAFLPQFSFFRSVNQLCVEESFMITLKCLMNAPADSYLCEIDLIKVIEILFHLTNPKNLVHRTHKSNQRQIQNNNICHENIVKSICFEILKEDNAFKSKTYLKVLQMSDLTDADYYSLKDIFQLSNDVHDHIQDKLIKKTAKKFSETVQTLLQSKPEYIQEQEQARKAEIEAASLIDKPNEQPENEPTQAEITYTQSNEDTVIDQNNTSDSKKKRLSTDMIDHSFKPIIKKMATKKANNSTLNPKPNDSTISSTGKTSSQLFQQPSTQQKNTRLINESIKEDEEQNDTVVDISTASNRTINTRRCSPRVDRNITKLLETSSAKKKVTSENTNNEEEKLKSIKLKELKVVVDKLSEKVIDKFNTKNDTLNDSEIIDESLTDSSDNQETRRQSLRSNSTRRSHSAITKSDSSQEPPVKMARGNSSKDVSKTSSTPTSTQSKTSSAVTANKEATKKPTIIIRSSTRAKASPSTVSPSIQNKLQNTRSSSTKTTSATSAKVNNERSTRSSSSKSAVLRQSNRKSK